MGMSTAGEGTRDKSHFIAIAVGGKSDKIAQTRQEISQVSRDLPPLDALPAFEVAARLKSNSRAAGALHGTTGDVGRQKIGRASGREGECQVCKYWVGAAL